jgi:hypothetical protein
MESRYGSAMAAAVPMHWRSRRDSPAPRFKPPLTIEARLSSSVSAARLETDYLAKKKVSLGERWGDTKCIPGRNPTV